jgi:RHS repeat-associated protein
MLSEVLKKFVRMSAIPLLFCKHPFLFGVIVLALGLTTAQAQQTQTIALAGGSLSWTLTTSTSFCGDSGALSYTIYNYKSFTFYLAQNEYPLSGGTTYYKWPAKCGTAAGGNGGNTFSFPTFGSKCSIAFSANPPYSGTATASGCTFVITPSASVSCTPSSVNYVATGSGSLTTCTANVNAPGSTANVAFSDNGTKWATTALDDNAAPATGFSPGTTPQTFNITAAFAGDSTYTAVSASTTFTITKGNPSISVGCTPFKYSVPSTPTCTASVGNGATGTVTWTLDGAAWTTTTLSGGSTTAAGVATWPAGSHTVGATYNGDGNGYNNAASASPTTLVIAKATPSVGVTCLPNPIIYGSSNSTTCTTTVSGVATGTVTVTVSSQSSTTTLSGGSTSTPLGAGLPAGTYSVNATYNGDENNNSVSVSAPTPLTISQATPSMSVSCSPSAPVYSPSTNNFSCSASVGDGATGNVTWTENSTTWENTSLSSGAAAVPGGDGWAVGTYNIVATYDGDANNKTTSASTSVNIVQAPQTINFSALTSPVSYGVGPITLSATGGASGNAVTFQVLSGPATITSGSQLNITGAGTVVVAANQLGNTNYAVAPQVSQKIVVNPEQLTATLTPSQNPVSPSTSTYLEPVTFWATFSSIPNDMTNSVTFYDSGAVSGNPAVVIGTAPISSQTGVAAFTISTLTVGNHFIVAVWQGGTSYAVVTSSPFVETVKQGTANILWPNPAPISYGTALGSTQLDAAASLYGTSVPGPFYYTPGSGAILPGGENNLSASFKPNDTLDFTSPTAANALIQVNPLTPTLSVGTSGVTSTWGGSVTFTATITGGPAGTVAPTGMVTFYDGGTAITTGGVNPATLNGYTATLTTSSMAVGAHTITASYTGDTNYMATTASAITQTVNQIAPTLTVATSTTPSIYGGSVTFTATVSSGPTGTVTFYDNLAVIGTGQISSTGSVGTANYATNTLAPGTHSITAGWAGNTDYHAVVSSAISQTVNQATPTLTMAASETPTTYGQPITFTAIISHGPSGTVTFYDGATAIPPGSGSSVTISSNTATLVTSSLTTGVHSITAGWAGNADYTSIISSAITQTVNKATPTLSLTVTPNPSSYANPAAFSASISNSVTGSVMFYDGNAVLGSSMIVNGVAIFTLTSTSVAGTHSITANWAGNANYNAVTSTVVTQTVNQATPTIAWMSPVNIPPDTPLSATQLNATANVPGAFAYSPALGTVLGTGSQTLSVTFTPTDTTDYSTATASVTLTVSEASGTGIIETVAGDGTQGYQDIPGIGDVGDGGPAIDAGFNAPASVAVDTSGNIYIADTYNNLIRKVTAATGNISTVAGTVTPTLGDYNDGYSGDGGSATSAELNLPSGIALDTSGNLYIADSCNNLIRKVTAAGIISTVAGNVTPLLSATSTLCGYNTAYPNNGYSGDGGLATSAELNSPGGIAVDASGNLYIADTVNNRVRFVAASTANGYTQGNIYTVAGGGSVCSQNTDSLGDGCPATSATLNSPLGIAVDAAGNLYIADTMNNRVRMVAASTASGYTQGNIYTVAGGGSVCSQSTGSLGDGCPATSATLNSLGGVALDSQGDLYIADTTNNLIRVVTAPVSTGVINTWAGGGTGCSQETDILGDGCPAISAELSNPTGVAVGANGSLYIADAMNYVVRAVGPGTATPAITWPVPAPIVYGTPLSANQLNASSAVPGTYAYSPSTGTTLTVGTHILSVTMTPNDKVNYNTAMATTTLLVTQATPTVTWTAPSAAVPYGTVLSAAQLNATASVPGAFAYAPALGTVLDAGPHLLVATFTPNDGQDYSIATAQIVVITSTPATGPSDTGTITLTVNGTQASSYNYGSKDTPSTIAEGLASAASSSLVTVRAVDDALFIEATTPGSASNYSYSLQTTSWDNTDFPSQPSFLFPAITGNLDGGTDAQTAGSPTQAYKFAGSYDPVGNLLSYTDLVMGTFNFTTSNGASGYDTLNRLSAGTLTPPGGAAQYFCWSYDSFGNRTDQASSSQPFTNAADSRFCQLAGSASQLSNSWATYNGNNQFVATSQAVGGVAYDASGNVLNDGTNQYLYNGDGQICAVASTPVPSMTTMTGYLYDAEGTRTAKGTITTWSCDPTVNGFQTIKDYVIGPGGEQVTEMGVDAKAGNNAVALAPQRNYVYADGVLIAAYDPDGLHFYLNDPLGSRRVQTDYAGVIEQQCTSLPFGDRDSCSDGHLFTGKERDAESGNDYFEARYYSSSMGRFMSPDWSVKVEPVPYSKLDDPQTLNLYAYVTNNPLTRRDLDGHCATGPDIQSLGCGGSEFVKAATQTFKLPSDPSGLGPGWKQDTSHKNPNGSKWTNEDGWNLEFHKGNGKKGSAGEDDHWHLTPPGEKKSKSGQEHLDPGDEVTVTVPDPKPEPAAEPEASKSAMDKVNDWLNDHLSQGVKDYLRDHPYGPNSSPAGVAPGPVVSPVLEFPW